MLFRKRISPYNVTDTVDFTDGEKTLTLTVKADAAALVVGIKKAHDVLVAVNDDSDEKTKAEAARAFACAMFGQEQGDKLCAFYRDPLTVIKVCGKYFENSLANKITKAQKK